MRRHKSRSATLWKGGFQSAATSLLPPQKNDLGEVTSLPAPGAILGYGLKFNKLASERRRYVCVKTSLFRGYFIPQTGAADRNPPLHWAALCLRQKRRFSEAILHLKRVRRIGIRLSIGRRYVCVKTSLFRGSFTPQTGAADRNPPLHWAALCLRQNVAIPRLFYPSNGVRRIGIRLSIGGYQSVTVRRNMFFLPFWTRIYLPLRSISSVATASGEVTFSLLIERPPP